MPLERSKFPGEEFLTRALSFARPGDFAGNDEPPLTEAKFPGHLARFASRASFGLRLPPSLTFHNYRLAPVELC